MFGIVSECRIFYRCVDWNRYRPKWKLICLCRIFYRCVDWNVTLVIIRFCLMVASFTDAWIETVLRLVGLFGKKVASFTDAWIETDQEPNYRHTYNSRIFYRCVDWNKRIITTPLKVASRIFYRCVDWNLLLFLWLFYFAVASFTDAWIETYIFL